MNCEKYGVRTDTAIQYDLHRNCKVFASILHFGVLQAFAKVPRNSEEGKRERNKTPWQSRLLSNEEVGADLVDETADRVWHWSAEALRYIYEE